MKKEDYQLKKAIRLRQDRMKDFNNDLSDPQQFETLINQKGKKRNQVEKIFLQEWTVEGKQEVLEEKETKNIQLSPSQSRIPRSPSEESFKVKI